VLLVEIASTLLTVVEHESEAPLRSKFEQRTEMGQARKRKKELGDRYGKPATLYATNKTLPKIILIGFDGAHNDVITLIATINRLRELRDLKLTERWMANDYDVYNMALVPERGDAMDHIDSDTGLVVTFHVNGLHYGLNMGEETDEHREASERIDGLIPGYRYTRNNGDLYKVCMNFGASLICWGEQPFAGLIADDQGRKRVLVNESPEGWLYEPTPNAVAERFKISKEQAA
jgi:hypothetical protein